MSAWQTEVDEFGHVEVLNESDVPLDETTLSTAVTQALASDPELASLVRWSRKVQSRARRGSLLERDRYVTPGTTFEQVRTARQALDDDVVDGIADLTEALAFKKVGFYANDEDQENAWNQWAATVNLDGLLRSAWRSHYTDSMAVFVMWWGRETYKVEGKTRSGRERRKTFNLRVPTAIDTIDSLKVTPVGDLLFGRERLAYIASPGEAAAFDYVLERRQRRAGFLPSGAPIPPGFPARPLPMRFAEDDEMLLDDEVVGRLIRGRYVPDVDERRLLLDDGVDPNHLFLLDPSSVFRHTATKGGHERFPRNRMKSVFELLDMKNLARQKDRVALLGGINFILIVKQGSDKTPALPAEIAHLKANVRTIAQMPIIVGPHTLTVEIVQPDQDAVLNTEKWDVLDDRLARRLLRQFGTRGNTDDQGDIAQLVGHWLESERHMLRRTLEQNVFRKIVAANPDLTAKAKLRFYPARIALAFDQAYASFLIELRQAREISRDTQLSQFEMSQADEAEMLQREAREFDPIFQTLAQPGAAPATPAGGGGAPGGGNPGGGDGGGRAAQRRAGRQGGGTRNGGGAAPGSGQGQEPRNPRRLSDAEVDAEDIPEADRRRALGRDDLVTIAGWLEVPGRHRMKKGELVKAIAVELGEEEPDD